MESHDSKGTVHWLSRCSDKEGSVLFLGGKHLQDKDSATPQLFHLPDGVAEANDLLALHPDRAKDQ